MKRVLKWLSADKEYYSKLSICSGIVWSGRNLDGAGTTAGEEVEMVNSYLSCCALTTKYMTKSARNDMLTVHAIGWNLRKQNSLHLSLSSRYIKTVCRTEMANKKLEDLCSELGCPENRVLEWVRDVRLWATDVVVANMPFNTQLNKRFLVCIRKKQVYNNTDSNKIRHLRRKKLREEKRKLFESIKCYNEQVPEEGRINTELVESKLCAGAKGDGGADSLIWPWEICRSETTSVFTKKKKMGLQEERVIPMREMRQHYSYLRGQAGSIGTLIAELSTGKNCK
ncbi:uncharacterized protein LOC143524906 [Brachyhypopomus gauderio]|uniref:uncharacterized protein LOC143524906 n=1 Tax=Brachyhypopomus gauderio TaxID=698409 RepID=UPI00404148AA